MTLLKKIQWRLRAVASVALTGDLPGQLLDEAVGVLIRRLVPCPETAPAAKRLNIVTPTLSPHETFGGVATLLDLPLKAFKAGLEPLGWRVRIICTGKTPDEAVNVARPLIAKIGIDPALVDFHYGSWRGNPVPVSTTDVFVASMWSHFYSVTPLLEFQKALRKGSAVPYVGLFQDYEAAFHPWSSAWMLTQAMYETDWPLVHVFNSKELADYFVAQGHKVERQLVFEPVMSASLRKALQEKAPVEKERQILFYGRPEVLRNCFYLVRAALEEWSEIYPNSRAWNVVSVGGSHPAFPLRNGRKVDVLGKLSLEEYSAQLQRSAVGFSLMASPHPSYPPLEMAHFGALTVTNSFASKDLTSWHENFISADHCDPRHLAAHLVEVCRRFEADPGVGLAGRSRKPAYLEEFPMETLRDLSRLISGCLDG